MKKLELVNVKEPNLLEHIFSHTEVPRISFEGKIYEEVDGNLVSFDPADIQGREIYITDTTFRD